MTLKMPIALWLVRSTIAVSCLIVTNEQLTNRPHNPWCLSKCLESMSDTWKKKSFCLLFTIVFGVHTGCTYTWVCVCWPDLPHVAVKASIKMSSSVTVHLLFWDRVCHWTWSSPFQLDWLACGPLGSACLYPSPHQCWGYSTWCPTQHFHTDSRDRNSSSHTHISSTFPTEPSFQPLGNLKASRQPFHPHPTHVNTSQDASRQAIVR